MCLCVCYIRERDRKGEPKVGRKGERERGSERGRGKEGGREGRKGGRERVRGERRVPQGST